MDQGDRDGADQRHPDPAQPPPALVQVVLRALEPPPVSGEGLRHISPAVLRRRRALGDRPGAHATRGKGTRKIPSSSFGSIKKYRMAMPKEILIS